MTTLFLIITFILGLAVGSFLNVIAYRSVHGGSIFFGRSRCPHCKKELKTADLIPIVSFLLLKGKCRYCGKKISLQYPLVEVATGVLFAFTFYFWNITYHVSSVSYVDLAQLIFLLFIVSVLVVLFVTDIKDGLLPNSIVLPAIIVVLAYKTFLTFFIPLPISSLLADLLAAFLAALAFFVIVFVSGERAMGGGDVKLVFLIGLIVGWPAILVSLFASFLTGAAVAVMLLLIGKKRFGQTIPFGPFLTIGGFIALFWGQQILDVYLRTINR
ncbi:MAG: prepilin peptidase [bacterium]|nr:prepilin peptidase [bacterium]